ncbi:LexA family protein [Brassicibacter mesophilus]|uniref:LexA family protein n=1 Tax=Brassicibacter mesophilus TaxID=745119 RepID=UPI003D1A5C8A
MVTPRNVLQVIAKYIDKNKISPSTREICGLTKVKSTQTIHRRIKILEEFGYIEKMENIPRSIRVTELGREVINF